MYLKRSDTSRVATLIFVYIFQKIIYGIEKRIRESKEMYFKDAEKIDVKKLSENELIQLEKDILKEKDNFTPKGQQRAGTKRILNKISSAKFLTAYAETIKFLKSEKRIQESNRGGKRDRAGRKKKEKTVMVRCPESIKDEILALIKKYKETGKLEIGE